ncbi:hypothetical protein FOB54_18130 [Citrobacter koseri]|nr:hypothetical protein FOB54_18130 [Citrobacter koseri]
MRRRWRKWLADCRMAAQAPYPAYKSRFPCRPDKRSAIRQTTNSKQRQPFISRNRRLSQMP